MKEVDVMTKTVEEVVSRVLPSVDQLSLLPETHLLRSLVTGQIMVVFGAPVLLPSPTPSGAIKQLLTDIKC